MKLSSNEVIKTMAEVLNEVAAERMQQIEKYGHQEELEDKDLLAILVEEVGEAAQALQKGSAAAKATDADDLYEEVIQIAAVATKWAETLKGYFPKGAGL